MFVIVQVMRSRRRQRISSAVEEEEKLLSTTSMPCVYFVSALSINRESINTAVFGLLDTVTSWRI